MQPSEPLQQLQLPWLPLVHVEWHLKQPAPEQLLPQLQQSALQLLAEGE